jgi:3-deoxy-D-manno-octulosonic acid (KDO) 8-phosphate synthase
MKEMKEAVERKRKYGTGMVYVCRRSASYRYDSCLTCNRLMHVRYRYDFIVWQVLVDGGRTTHTQHTTHNTQCAMRNQTGRTDRSGPG